MRRPRWQLITWQGRTYAKYGRQLYKCCKRNIAPKDWVYIKDLDLAVCYKCIGAVA